MNLSNYLQMPPAPQSPAPAGTSSAPAAAPLVGVDAAGRFKLDFARIMAQQFQQLPTVKRQDLAALRASIPSDASRTGQRPDTRDDSDKAASEHEDTARNSARSGNDSMTSTRASLMARAATSLHTSARATPAPADARQPGTAATSRRHADVGDERDNTTRQEAEPAPERKSTRQVETDAALLWASEMVSAPVTTSVAPASNPTASAMPSGDWPAVNTDASAWRLPDGTPLQSLSLSPEVQIVTDPSHAPTPQSLLNFARDMGLDEASLRQLVGEAHGSLTQPATAPGAGTAAAWLAHQVIQQIQNTPTAVANPLVSAQMGGAEWLQSGWLPAAPVAANAASGTVTLDVLTLNGPDLPQAQITALAESFLAGDDASSSSDNPNPHDGQPAFAPAAASTPSNTSTPASHVNAGQATRPMAEVYQQLSDKLSTEMAARMHQQISAGEWKMKFGLRPAHLGSVEIQLEMKDGKLHADLAADNPLTRELLQNGSQRLKESLANLGIQAERVSVGQGQTLFGQGQAGAQGQGASQGGQLEDNPNPSTATASAVSEPTRSTPKDPDGLLDLYA